MLFQQPITTVTHNSAASTNATSVKAGPVRLLTVAASNINAAARYLKLYDKASAPTVGTDVPKLTIQLPASGAPVALNLGERGVDFPTGLAFAITTGATDADAVAVAANEIKVILAYAA